jgi:hypothetical protein
MNKKKSSVAFAFVLDLLSPLEINVKPLFGCHALYVAEKIVLILRKKDAHPEANGIWIATSAEHHSSLKKIFPSMGSVYILSDGKSETNWQMIHEHADDFESAAVLACELVLKNDPRIGRIPAKKKRAAKKK